MSDLKAVDPRVLCAIFNFFLLRGSIPSIWKGNRTTLIPKKPTNLENASNWRPITISSVILHLLHKILAQRLTKNLHLNKCQKVFLPTDGIAQNTLLLDTVIARARQLKTNLSIVGIDLSKVFDSVSHHSIKRALTRHGVDHRMIAYIMNTYFDSTTSITCGRSTIHSIHLFRGVKQGDPLSPILFNLVLDELFTLLPAWIGARIDNTWVNSLAFADDVILLAETKPGMDQVIPPHSSKTAP